MKTVVGALEKADDTITAFLVNIGYDKDEINKLYDLDTDDQISIVMSEIILQLNECGKNFAKINEVSKNG